MSVGKTVPTLLKVVLMIHGVLRCSAQNAASSWPVGTYGLPKTRSGCPTGWSEGSRYQDTEDSSPINLWSQPLDLDGSWGLADMQYKFCMKTQIGRDGVGWPAGSYCIYKKGTCPAGFQSGSIHWDDEDSSNANTHSGTLPDGSYNSNTLIYFCCRNDGVAGQAISLPSADRFMLLSRFDSCQQVQGMTVTKEWFRWDTEDDQNADRQSSVHPYEGIMSIGADIKLNFCFYVPSVVISSSWPDGTYGIPKSMAGCPSGWEDGYRYQDTEDSLASNLWSQPLHLDGTWNPSSMQYKFCMKTQTGRNGVGWPAGSYCTYKKGTCPAGFQSGFISWDDEDSANANRHGGTLPDGSYNSNTLIYFCCRNDGLADNAISLGIDDRFMLLSRSGSCQQVQGMTVTKEWFRWDTEDDQNADRQSSVHPYEGKQDGVKNILLYFCYYTPQ